jgi:hypothetical protein
MTKMTMMIMTMLLLLPADWRDARPSVLARPAMHPVYRCDVYAMTDEAE